jgi:hypothetical protein
MAEPVSTTAAAAAAGAATAASPAASAAAPAAGAGSGGGAAGAGAPGSGANSPAYGLKSQGSPLDSVATQPTSGIDVSAMQRALGCHDGSGTTPQSISPQAQGEMPNFGEHWFNAPGQHGRLQLPQIESPGDQTLRQPDSLPGESLREPSAGERAQRTVRPPQSVEAPGPRPEARATALPEAQPNPHAPPGPQASPSPVEPTAQAFAQSPEPGSPPTVAPHPAEPTPEESATAPAPSRVPDRNTPGEMPPLLGPKAEALTVGVVSGFFGFFVKGLGDMGDLIVDTFLPDGDKPEERVDVGAFMFDTFAMHSDKPGAREDFEQARDEFGSFGEEAGRYALDKDETFATLGMLGGGFGPEILSPGSKVKAAGAAAGAAGATGALLKQQIKKKLKNRAAARAARAAAVAVEKTAAYLKLAKVGKLTKKPVTNSQGSWFQKWLSKKNYEYVGQLKNGKTVQIDDLAQAADGKLVLIEAKFMKPATELAESGHVKFGAEKVEHIGRLVKFFKENRETVSHIEITVSREEAAMIYAELISQSPSLAQYVGTIIRFGMP